MNESPHAATSFVGPLKDLAEGRMEPDAWIEWWNAHAGEIEAVCPRGWFLKLKPRQLEDSGVNRAAFISQEGACTVLEALKVPFVCSDRYQRAWKEDFHLFCEQEKARKHLRTKQFAPRIDALAMVFPKFAQFLRKRAGEIDQMEEPAHESDIAKVEQVLGVPLPGAYRQLLKCTRAVNLGGLSICLEDTGSHPAVIPGEKGSSAAICIAEYWLEADGDQVLVECSSTPEHDPPVFYYAHAVGSHTARRLAPSLSTWLESLPKSPVFRR
jgi:hypothetical protein